GGGAGGGEGRGHRLEGRAGARRVGAGQAGGGGAGPGGRLQGPAQARRDPPGDPPGRPGGARGDRPPAAAALGAEDGAGLLREDPRAGQGRQEEVKGDGMSVIASTPVPAPAPAPAAPALPLYRLSVTQYEAMAEHGILTTNDRVELIRGLLVQKMTIKPPHAVCVDLVHDALSAVIPAGWHVRTQAPLVLADSVPEPDDC